MPVPHPERRRLRVFAFDPMLARQELSELTIDVANEPLLVGPSGTRVKVVDYDASRKAYLEPVDLDDPTILMQDGLPPSETDPRFHQQMVYAVALKVLENFDRALGRPITFRGGRPLLLLPHAFRGANAFFDPALGAVCFGYFTASETHPGDNLPGQTVFTCLSQDIIAHEVTHAVIHRMREYFNDASNRDVLAFHEGFADIVAIFQHFTFPEVLSRAIAGSRGDLRSSEGFLGLAEQFGHATGRNGALRTAVHQPDPTRYAEADEPHERGSILVAAVFDAFFDLYQWRVSDLLRIASDGSGVLRPGQLLPDLVDRLAREASRAAQSVLTMCIRAFEYLPPVDVTFGDFLRAIITADHDLTAEGGADQRRAMIEAFRRRGIYPEDVFSFAEDALRLTPAGEVPRMPGEGLAERLAIGAKRQDGRYAIGADEESTGAGDAHRDPVFGKLRDWATSNAAALHLDPKRHIEVKGFHATFRVRTDGSLAVDVVAQFLQMESTKGDPAFGGLPFRGGTTVVAAADGQVRFIVAKPLSEARRAQQLAHVRALDDRHPVSPWADERTVALRARRDLRDLHAGLYA